MIGAREIELLYKECGRNPYRFGRKIKELLGVTTDKNGNPTKLKETRMLAEDFSIRNCAKALLGQEFLDSLHNTKTREKQLEELYDMQLSEASSPLTPSSFLDINAWSAISSGLVQAKLLEGYQSPEFIGMSLVSQVQVESNGGKHITIARVKAPDKSLEPGEELPPVNADQRYIWRPRNKKFGNNISLTAETLIYDLSGELLSLSAALGQTLGQLRDCMIGCVIMNLNLGGAEQPSYTGSSVMIPSGFEGRSYRYLGNSDDSANATYQTAAGTGDSAKYNYINEIASNTLTDFTSFQAVEKQLNLQTEYETGFRINAELKDALVSPNAQYAARNVINSTQVIPISGGGSTTQPTNYTLAQNPVPNVNLYSSKIFNDLLTDSGASQANSDNYWYAGDFKKAFGYANVWDIRTDEASPQSNSLMSRQIVNQWYCSTYGTPFVLDPRFVIFSHA